MPRRILVLLLLAVAVGTPAAVLRVLCIGDACDRPQRASAEVPFCSLPASVREPLVRGFREGRSPDVMAVSDGAVSVGSSTARGGGAAWPTTSGPMGTRVPIVFSGVGVSEGAEVPPGTGLDDIAPTVAEVVDLRRPHPEVRSGRALDGIADGRRPRMVLLVALHGVGSDSLEASAGRWPYLDRLVGAGAGTLEGDTTSLPVDPTASLTTIGTGGQPRQHGVTGGLVRNDAGEVTTAWGRRAPVSVIAALGDDLDEQLKQRPRIGLVASEEAQRGIVGGNWYVTGDRDDRVDPGSDPVSAAERVMDRGYGEDRVPDLLAVVLEGSLPSMDRDLRGIVRRAGRSAGGSLAVVVTATGGHPSVRRTERVPASRVVRAVEKDAPGAAEVVEGVAAGGLFTDQETLARESISEDELTRTLRDLRIPSGRKVFVDVFPAIAVSFARYC